MRNEKAKVWCENANRMTATNSSLLSAERLFVVDGRYIDGERHYTLSFEFSTRDFFPIKNQFEFFVEIQLKIHLYQFTTMCMASFYNIRTCMHAVRVSSSPGQVPPGQHVLQLFQEEAS